MFSKSLRNTSPSVLGFGWLQASSPRTEKLDGSSVSKPGMALSQSVMNGVSRDQIPSTVPISVRVGSEPRIGRFARLS
jgi:hypothetical protein